MNPWENFARENAEWYILTHPNIDYKSPEGLKYFFSSGNEDMQRTIKNVLPYLKNRNRCLEIGAGVGRLAIAHAEIFSEVWAIDVSETMLAKLQQNATAQNVNSIKGLLANENWSNLGSFDYVYSFLVFQHIDKFSIIESYIERISDIINSDSIVQLHFDTRLKSLGYFFRFYIPDFLLPKTQRTGMRRIRQEANLIRGLFKSKGLKIVSEFYPDSADHIFIISKSI